MNALLGCMRLLGSYPRDLTRKKLRVFLDAGQLGSELIEASHRGERDSQQPALCSITALFKARFQGLKGMGSQVTA